MPKTKKKSKMTFKFLKEKCPKPMCDKQTVAIVTEGKIKIKKCLSCQTIYKGEEDE